MLPNDISGKRILLSPLNWGMGHVSRCIPLIALFKDNGNEVIVAGNEKQIYVLKQYFPDLKFINHEGYPFFFAGKGNFVRDLLSQSYVLWKYMRNERKVVDILVKQLEIDVVLSDHRYGFYSKQCPSIFLTHQLQLPVRFYEWPARLLHFYLMKKFDKIWVPDFATNELAGRLSRSSSFLNVNYIGPLSRFSLYDLFAREKNRELVVVSGPQPYAQQYFDEQVMKREAHTLYIVPEEIVIQEDVLHSRNIIRATDWRRIDTEMLSARKIYSRSGYSTLMDVYVLNCKYAFTATPGQSEQIYLASLWNQKTDSFT